MSFSKARLQRFNEIPVCSPSPAKYNVASSASKSRCALFPQSERYSKKVSPTVCSDSGSIQSAPCFQTPSVPKKKRLLTLSLSKKRTVDIEELNEKIVECNNKDICIRELTEEIEDIKIKLADLQHEKEEIISSSKQLQEILAENDEKILNIQSKYEDAVEKMSKIQNEKDVEIKNLQDYLTKERKISELKQQELHSIKIKHEEIVKDLTSELIREKSKSETIKNDLEAKIKLTEENFRETTVFLEIQMKQKLEQVENDYKLRLEENERESSAILKECQAISEYNIIQSELEKNQLKNELAAVEAELENFKIFNLPTEEEQEDSSFLMEELKKTRDTLDRYLREKRKYDITIDTLQGTIEVLKKRLIDSDRDVEQLKEEVSYYEEQLISSEDKCTNLMSNLDEARASYEELEMQMESMVKQFRDEAQNLEQQLLNKVKNSINVIRSSYGHKEEEMFNFLNKMFDVLTQSSSLITTAEEQNSKLEEMAKKLVIELKIKDEALDFCHNELVDAAEVRKRYIDISGKYDEILQKREEMVRDFEVLKEENRRLASKISEQINLSGLYEQNVELSSKNYELKVLVEKLQKETLELKKQSKKVNKIHSEDKENLGSPRRMLTAAGSPGPLKEKN